MISPTQKTTLPAQDTKLISNDPGSNNISMAPPSQQKRPMKKAIMTLVLSSSNSRLSKELK